MAFNKEAFLNQTVEKVMDTSRPPFPEDIHEDLQITKVDITDGIISKGDRKGKPWAQLNLTLGTNDPDIKAEMKITDEDRMATVRYDVFLDLDDDGNLDVGEGRNIGLGKLRQAVGQNNEDEWTIMDLHLATVPYTQVKHRFNDDGDAFANVTRVFGDNDED